MDPNDIDRPGKFLFHSDHDFALNSVSFEFDLTTTAFPTKPAKSIPNVPFRPLFSDYVGPAFSNIPLFQTFKEWIQRNLLLQNSIG